MFQKQEQRPQVEISDLAALQVKFNQARGLHQRGKLADAERCYREVLRQLPNHFGALHLLGVIALQTGHTERAVEIISKAIELDASATAAHNDLGKALRGLKRPEEALASFDRAIALKPDFADAYNNRGLALQDMMRPADALTSYDRAIAINRDYAEAYDNRGNALSDLKRPADALASYDKAIALKPDHAMAHNNRSNALLDLSRPAEALVSCDKAIALNPDFAIAYYNRGNALQDLKRPEDALASYGKAIGLNRDFALAYYNRGIVLMQLKRAEDALASYDKTITLKPDYIAAYNNRGLALQDLNRPEDALLSYDKAIALKPDFADAYNNRGNALHDLRRPEDALASFDRAIALKPHYAEANLNKSFSLLLQGRFEQGWRQYEWRKKRKVPIAARSFPQPLWLGEEDISGKTLFIWWEQGLGDTIQFCRYARLAEAQGAKVIMSVQQPLRGLLKQISPTIEIINSCEVPTDFDYNCPLMSLPLAFRTTLATIPAQQSYLKSDEELRVSWSTRLPPMSKPRIGLVWSGRKEHTNDYNRSIELDQLRLILSPDADWICLQNEIREKDFAALQQLGQIAYFGDELRDFSDAAALLDLMDVIITVDTSVAHLAGAMGKPVWILLPYNADWRWLLDRDDSPWYPSARLFRQQQIGDWAGVIERVKSELRSVIG